MISNRHSEDYGERDKMSSEDCRLAIQVYRRSQAEDFHLSHLVGGRAPRIDTYLALQCRLPACAFSLDPMRSESTIASALCSSLAQDVPLSQPEWRGLLGYQQLPHTHLQVSYEVL